MQEIDEIMAEINVLIVKKKDTDRTNRILLETTNKLRKL